MTSAPPPVEDRQIVVLFQSDTSLNGPMVYSIIDQLGGVCLDDEKQPRVDLWLESPGGDAHAAYKLALFLRARFEKVYVVVPDYAKSAATLLALAADTIYMAPSAELGPLDMQENREGDIRLRSALDTAHSIEALFQRAVQNALVEGGQVIQATRLSREKVITHLLEFSANFYRPLIEQLDPLAIFAASTGLEVTVEYGIRLLQGNNPTAPPEMLRERVRTLVTGYPTHGFVIDRNEARSLGLPVVDIREYDMRIEVETAFRSQQESGTNIITVGTPADFKIVSNDNGGGEENGKATSNGRAKANSRTKPNA